MKQAFHFAKRIHFYSGKVLYLNMTAMIIISLLEGLGIFLLLPLISIAGIIDINNTNLPNFSWILNWIQDIPENHSLFIILGVYVLLILGQSLFQRNQQILSAKIQQGFARHMKQETYKNLMDSNWAFFLKKRKSDIINMMTQELGRVIGGVALFLQFISSIIFTLIQISLALWLSTKMTLFVLFFGLLLIYFARAYTKKFKSLGVNGFQLSRMYIGGITDHFNGIKDIKSNSLEGIHLKWFENLCLKMERNFVEFTKLKTKSQLLYKSVSAILIAIFVFFSIKMFQAQPAQLMLILVIFSRLWPRFSAIQSSLEQLEALSPSFNALLDLQNDCLKHKEIDGEYANQTKGLFINKGLECKDVYFRYNPVDSNYALKNINITIPANCMTAIVGPSGAGKSTLIDLVMGLNKPEKGKVIVDEKELNANTLLLLRKSISYVPQDPFLFNDSIRENLLLVQPGAKEKDLWSALEFSSAAEFVRKLPNGLETVIGDRGIKLSGGERQRIVLARAILRRPSILVLDEATSALDSENEYKIQQALESLKGSMTIIVIAHRLSTIRNADHVIVLENGQIIQQGDYNQLAIEKGTFKNLLRQQIKVSQ